LGSASDGPVEGGLEVLEGERVLEDVLWPSQRRRARKDVPSLGPPLLLAETTEAAAAKTPNRKEKRASMVSE